METDVTVCFSPHLRRKQEREQLITTLSQSLGAEFTEEVVKEIVGEISAKELK